MYESEALGTTVRRLLISQPCCWSRYIAYVESFPPEKSADTFISGRCESIALQLYKHDPSGDLIPFIR